MKNQDNESGSPEHAFNNKTGEQHNACPNGYHHSNRYSEKCYTYINDKLTYVDDFTKIETDYDMALVSFDTLVELKEVGVGGLRVILLF
jgi:hypothetical protein